MEYITIDEFAKIEARIGKVIDAQLVEGSEKLIKCTIDFGESEPRQILSGIRSWYPDPSVLVGKQLLYCTNLLPRKMVGHESQGMLMAVDGLDGAPVFLVPEKEVQVGVKIH